jgi:hypothetical protein
MEGIKGVGQDKPSTVPQMLGSPNRFDNVIPKTHQRLQIEQSKEMNALN